MTKLFRCAPCALAFFVAAAAFGCAEPPPEEKASTSSEITSNADICELAAGTTALAVMALAASSQATGGCVVVAAVTGPGEVVCLAPAAGVALSAITGLVAGSVAYLTCQGITEAVTQTQTSTDTSRPDRCSIDLTNELEATMHYWCDTAAKDYGQSGRSCGSTENYYRNPLGLTCEDATQRASLNDWCASYRSRVMDCYSTRPPGDHHGEELERASTSASLCRGLAEMLCAEASP